jgi:hypothetical protein
MTPDYVKLFQVTDWEEVIAYHGENVIVRRDHEMVELAPDRLELDAMPF